MSSNLLLSITDDDMLRLHGGIKASIAQMRSEDYEDEEICTYEEVLSNLKNGKSSYIEGIKLVLLK
ncbi:hypothetical protein [Pontibacter harenae]|uniref:hypothetical protein n=1 Tax=Pontibacter harenae TaxID=2894083 RepID=UPI001E4C6E95|nr:hypothetical protein [Pontibacter harenae]MCC9165616.1 hypothetical protein [Pontibacter harenae]